VLRKSSEVVLGHGTVQAPAEWYLIQEQMKSEEYPEEQERNRREAFLPLLHWPVLPCDTGSHLGPGGICHGNEIYSSGPEA
jgi:hypothetical protein